MGRHHYAHRVCGSSGCGDGEAAARQAIRGSRHRGAHSSLCCLLHADGLGVAHVGRAASSWWGGGGSAWSTDFMRHWWPFAAAIFAPLVHYLLPAPHSALCLQSCSVERCDAKRALRVRCCVNSAAVHAGESLSAVSRWHAICFTDPGVQPEGESGATVCVWLLRNHSHRAEGEMKGRWR